MEKTVIKKCVNDECDAIFHNVPVKWTICLDCGYSGALCRINEKTYHKFRWIHFQYDFPVALEAYENDEIPPFYYPEILINNQLRIDL